MSAYATRKRGAKQATAAANRYDREAAAHLAAVRDARAAAGAAADAQRAASDAAAHCDIASIEPGDTVRDRHGWNLVTRVNVTTVTVRGPFGAEHIPLERIIETRKAAARHRQPVPGEVWTRTRTGREYECLATFAGEFHRWAAWGAHVDLSPEVFHVSDMTPPPELPPAELVASVGEHWTSVYPSGSISTNRSHELAQENAGRDRIWLIHPDGRWQKCNGKEVIGDPVEVPR